MLQVPAHVAFPILAIAPSARHVGIVCLNGRLGAMVARCTRTRGKTSLEEVFATLRSELEHEVSLRGACTVVIERDFPNRSSSRTVKLAERLAEAASDLGPAVRRVSFASACARIAMDGSSRGAARLLLERYEALRSRLAPRGVPLLRHEQWREAKPLVRAFALAHAVGIDILTTAVRSLGSGPPPTNL